MSNCTQLRIHVWAIDWTAGYQRSYRSGWTPEGQTADLNEAERGDIAWRKCAKVRRVWGAPQTTLFFQSGTVITPCFSILNGCRKGGGGLKRNIVVSVLISLFIFDWCWGCKWGWRIQAGEAPRRDSDWPGWDESVTPGPHSGPCLHVTTLAFFFFSILWSSWVPTSTHLTHSGILRTQKLSPFCWGFTAAVSWKVLSLEKPFRRTHTHTLRM